MPSFSRNKMPRMECSRAWEFHRPKLALAGRKLVCYNLPSGPKTVMFLRHGSPSTKQVGQDFKVQAGSTSPRTNGARSTHTHTQRKMAFVLRYIRFMLQRVLEDKWLRMRHMVACSSVRVRGLYKSQVAWSQKMNLGETLRSHPAGPPDGKSHTELTRN